MASALIFEIVVDVVVVVVVIRNFQLARVHNNGNFEQKWMAVMHFLLAALLTWKHIRKMARPKTS
jgi:hypothetical protein